MNLHTNQARVVLGHPGNAQELVCTTFVSFFGCAGGSAQLALPPMVRQRQQRQNFRRKGKSRVTLTRDEWKGVANNIETDFLTVIDCRTHPLPLFLPPPAVIVMLRNINRVQKASGHEGQWYARRENDAQCNIACCISVGKSHSIRRNHAEW